MLNVKDVPALARADCAHLRFDPPPDVPEPLTRYELFFPIIENGQENEGSGYGFDCDETGFVFVSELNEGTARSLWMLLQGESPDAGREYGPGRIRSWQERVSRVRGWMFCPGTCGQIIHLSGFTNTCDRCGADYNGSGQRLAPREQWGEETGETAEEILRVDCERDDEGP